MCYAGAVCLQRLVALLLHDKGLYVCLPWPEPSGRVGRGVELLLAHGKWVSSACTFTLDTLIAHWHPQTGTGAVHKKKVVRAMPCIMA